MNKAVFVVIAAFAILALVVSMPVAQAQVVQYLPSLFNGLRLAVGAACVFAGYVVYHISSTAYEYFAAFGYYRWHDHHAYTEHKYEFPYLFSPSPPSQSQFEKVCKDNINDKSSWRVHRLINPTTRHFYVWNPGNQMLTIGDKDGKSILTCYKCDSRCFNKFLQNGYKEVPLK